MKLIVYVSFIALLPYFCFADAGFNIRRPKAPCYAVFTGMDKLPDYVFLEYAGYELDKYFAIYNNERLRIYYAEGENRWHGPLRIVIRDKKTQQNIDSFMLAADGYNVTINFAGVENNKVKYSIDKTKADYPYELFMGEDTENTSLAKRNRYILIALSVIGFLTLAFMFFKKRNTSVSQPPENI
ncbi:MAG: hypothetical protein ABIQ07_05410 [Ginsengibacter sp.]